MLRRREGVVSVSGNHEYWSGADEMAVVLGQILPFELGGIKHNLPRHPHFRSSTAWVYASDDLYADYRLTDEDASRDLRETFLHILRWLIYRHSNNPDNARFTDKSQVYTVRASFISELLRGKSPRFILVTRDPYALVYRAPDKAAALKRLPSSFSRRDKMRIAAQHWRNSMEAILEDREELEHFLQIRFEDLLRNPKEIIKKICRTADLSFSEGMLPSEDDVVPFGSRYRSRWYPIRKKVNNKYYEKMDKRDVNLIKNNCGEIASSLGYSQPI
jgi:hypothetical protein